MNSDLIGKIKIAQENSNTYAKPKLVDGIQILKSTHGRTKLTNSENSAKSKIKVINFRRGHHGRTPLESKIKPRLKKVTNSNQDLQKKWNKLSSGLKIQAVLVFITKLSVKLNPDQVNQLKYLLISAISQKKLNCLADVNYDSEQGHLIGINKVKYFKDQGKFVLMSTVVEHSISLDSFGN